MRRFAVLLSYAGTRYCGWQRQEGSAASGNPSIQETIEKALQKMTSEKLNVVGSGRTDAGVHAAGQVAHFSPSRREWKPDILAKGLNSLLPRDIRVLKAAHVDPSFHAQRSAVKKQYSFYFQQGPVELPHLSPFSWWIRKRLNIEKMGEALRPLIGKHDFIAFRASGAAPGTTVREILEGEVRWEAIAFPNVRPEFGLVRLRVMGTGFLKQMVRGIAGTLLQVGEERRPPECTREILQTKDRKKVGATAAGRGLWLERVWYPDDPFGD